MATIPSVVDNNEMDWVDMEKIHFPPTVLLALAVGAGMCSVVSVGVTVDSPGGYSSPSHTVLFSGLALREETKVLNCRCSSWEDIGRLEGFHVVKSTVLF